jgi:hypothetical protein
MFLRNVAIHLQNCVLLQTQKPAVSTEVVVKTSKLVSLVKLKNYYRPKHVLILLYAALDRIYAYFPYFEEKIKGL